MHWADVLAAELLDRGPRHVLATGITPSGPIHVGNMREILTADAVHRSLLRLGKERGVAVEAELLYIADSYDPLRKVYPFLPASYAEHVGKPLSDIPCPCGAHASYAEHFLEPFFGALKELGVEPRVLRADELYRSGAYLESVRIALEHSEELRGIIARVSGRELPRDWIPFNAQCASCGRLDGPRPLLYEAPFVEYECRACGHEGRKDLREPGGGKLPWRVDWPARWRFLGVTFEAFGKDHAAAGSSWDTGQEIARRVYEHEPPLHTVYEFVLVKGVGAMHSSTGIAVSAGDMLRMTPPEVLRFLILRPRPEKHIEFDPGLGLVKLADEHDRWLRALFGKEPRSLDMAELERVVELSQPRGLPSRAPPDVPYGHLVLLLQATRGAQDQDKVVVARLRERGFDISAEEEAWLRSRLAHARFWLERYAPPEAKVEVRAGLSEEMRRSLSAEERGLLALLAESLAKVPWRAEEVHNAVHEAAKAQGLEGAVAFRAVYKALLGQERGPRAGHFLASLEREFVLRRFAEAGEP